MNFETLHVNREGGRSIRGNRRATHEPSGAELVSDLVSLIRQAEADGIRVLVFKSADSDYFISHVDATQIKEYRQEAAKLTGEPSIALLFRHLSASRLVTIAQIEGRARAAGSEFVLACDMRFAARESAIFSQPEPAQTDPAKFIMPLFAPRLIYSTATVRGWWLPRWVSSQPLAEVRAARSDLLTMLSNGALTPPAIVRYSFEDSKRQYAWLMVRQGSKRSCWISPKDRSRVPRTDPTLEGPARPRRESIPTIERRIPRANQEPSCHEIGSVTKKKHPRCRSRPSIGHE